MLRFEKGDVAFLANDSTFTSGNGEDSPIEKESVPAYTAFILEEYDMGAKRWEGRRIYKREGGVLIKARTVEYRLRSRDLLKSIPLGSGPMLPYIEMLEKHNID